MDRFQAFASSAHGDEVRILHLPSLRFDVLDRPLGDSPLYFGLGSSLGYLTRSELRFHARNAVRVDLYPYLALPLAAGGWSVTSEVALREPLIPSARPGFERLPRRNAHHQPRSAQPDQL